MSFIQGSFAPRPLHTREQVMATMVAVADELGMPDKLGACIIAGMTVSQEVGANGQFWCPGNRADPCFDNEPDRFPHDSVSDDGRSVGYYQQQTSGPGDPSPWGWGGLYGDPEGTRKRMDLHDSTVLFMDALKRLPYAAGNAVEANRWAQAVQRSGVPDGYLKHWGTVNDLYERVATGVTPPPKPQPIGWTGDPTWLEDVLRPALGDRLKTLPGWQAAGHGDFRDIRGTMIHHTGNSRESAQSIRNGRPDLEGPLSNLHIAPDGTVTIVAVGVCWHAGAGSYPWLPTNMGNWHLIGIECAWPDIGPGGSYDEHQRWPDAQIISMRDTCAALTLKLGFTEERVVTHKEYAGRAQGKWDPGNLDPNWFRAEVAKDMRGAFDEHPPIEPDKPGEVHPPVIQPPGTPPAGAYAHVLLHFGMSGPDVAALQARLKRAYSKLQVDGTYGSHTSSCVADYQKLHPPLDVDGIVGPAAAAALQLVLP